MLGLKNRGEQKIPEPFPLFWLWEEPLTPSPRKTGLPSTLCCLHEQTLMARSHARRSGGSGRAPGSDWGPRYGVWGLFIWETELLSQPSLPLLHPGQRAKLRARRSDVRTKGWINKKFNNYLFLSCNKHTLQQDCANHRDTLLIVAGCLPLAHSRYIKRYIYT